MALAKLSAADPQGASSGLRSISGAIVLVTGAASGIGEATARLFAAEGAAVALIDKNAAQLRSVVAAITATGGAAQGWALDLAEHQHIARVIGAVAETFGGLDCLVNNAGVAATASIEDAHFDEVWDHAQAVMVTSVTHIVRAALPWLKASPFPRIINIASTEAQAATKYLSAYGAAKAGLTGLTRHLAVELGGSGITVNCILPGPIETGMTAHLQADKKAAFARSRTALRRYGWPEEIAHMVLSLCLPGASYVTGATIPVDGGLLIRGG